MSSSLSSSIAGSGYARVIERLTHWLLPCCVGRPCGVHRPRIASVIRAAATEAATLCIRMMRAPFMIETTAAAIEPSSRRGAVAPEGSRR